MSESCASIHRLFNGLTRFNFPFDKGQLCRNGIYVLFEAGEKAHGFDRIVRVGTHVGAAQLRSRLAEHFVKENKDRSIFRKNIGRCILSQLGDPFLSDWEIDRTSRETRSLRTSIDLAKLREVEQQVSSYIRKHFSFSVIGIAEKEDRLRLESRVISTISLCEECDASATWLGRCSPKTRIRQSGLWLTNELWKEPLTSADLDLLMQCNSTSELANAYKASAEVDRQIERDLS